MKIINATPHDIVIVGEKENRVIKSIGLTIRLQSETVQTGNIDGIPLTKTVYGGTLLPLQIDGTVYIVSKMVAEAYPQRKDFYIVNETVHDENGKIIGCRSLSQI